MKKSFLLSIVLVLAAFAISCNTEKKTDITPFVGQWIKANADSTRYILELSADYAWNYYKNDSLLEKGKFDLQEGIFVMKHSSDEDGDHGHSHSNGEAHTHADDHTYQYQMNETKTELKLTHGEKTSTFNKL